ncbi:MAG TPA: TolC family protein [Verrucomicrobiae bacterium]|jgi:outer membrane protein TolC
MRRQSIIVLSLMAGALVSLCGCAHFQPQPISPEKTAADFDSRSLTNENLQAFLSTNHFSGAWDLRSLTLVAFYYQPALAEAQSQWTLARAAEITAGERPNPTVSVTPGYDTQIPNNPSPWMIPVSFDIPIETAGKRGKRIEEAKHSSEAAYWDYIGQIWQARSHVRAALLSFYAAQEDEKLISGQETAQNNVVRLLEGQLQAGSISSYEVTQARVTLETTQLARQDAIGQLNQARAQLAGVLGVPLGALAGVEFSFNDFKNFPRDLTAPEIRRQALLNRADVRGALAEYAASQSALQIEIANQYPDVHLGPGYAWNNGNAGDNEWQLGLTVTLPLLNQNQGGIAGAKAKRAEAAAHFLTIQAGAISEIDSAVAGYDAALQKSATAEKLSTDLQRQMDSTRAQARAGEIDALALANAETEFAAGGQSRMDALVQAQQALGQLEDAAQSPLTLPPETLGAAINQKTQR